MPSDAPSLPPDCFSIRSATNRDVSAIRAVLDTVRREYGVYHERGTKDPELDDLEKNFHQNRGCFKVVVSPGARIVGCAGLWSLGPNRAELGKMYLEEPARGRGLGKRLLEDLLTVARRNGYQEVWLETNSVLHAAISLYTKYGFQPVDCDHLLPRCDQAYLLRLDEGGQKSRHKRGIIRELRENGSPP